ncbi:hypothetical protein MKJ01_07695 [Chryseobacterium sp. SSA4.19]|uniref:hypothetical protein n=1 Tax=Chryseobacterium sp. SSA4.19 TaxID=2919915 RepID=UPI001F4DAC0E|nr:hypothetical protein [Chryseobacterium sp. SSA4.19]MCJ8153646.1 hypothetical protein [Chryseobacterium sp. SSA4.19]
MITKEQEQQIIDYLILHKLPVDILLEIKDHMTSQVSDIQMSENISFDQAFLKTQKLWESEFKMTHYSLFFSEEIPMIVKKIVKEKYNAILKRALLFGILSFGIHLLLIFLSADQEMYSDLFRLYNSCFVLIPFLLWTFNAKMRKYVKRNFKYKGRLFYTVYQYNLGLFIVCVNVMFQVILHENYYAFNFFRTEHQVALFPLLIALLVPFILHVMIIFVLINFFEHKKSLYKMQGFLNLPAE